MQALLGKVNRLYLQWADAKGAGCSECMHLNHYFSHGVDSVKSGQKQHLPAYLSQPPEDAASLGV